MKMSKTKLAAIGIMSGAAGVVGMGSVAGATGYDEHHDQQKDHDKNWSESKHDKNSESQHYKGNGWDNWKPDNYKQSHDEDFSKWWGNMNNKVHEYGNENWDKKSKHDGDQSKNWTPSGDDWQSDWDNWNPEMWWNHGSSYENWRDHITSYMSYSKVTIQIQYETAVSYYSSNSNDRNKEHEYSRSHY